LAQLDGSVMTFSCPSFSAAATRAEKPPPACADVAVAQFVLLELELLLAGVVLELELLLQPAASKMLPIAAPAATIALVARKISSICRPGRTAQGIPSHLG
jgi:hypothetical protein